jgi:hypothetical protein
MSQKDVGKDKRFSGPVTVPARVLRHHLSGLQTLPQPATQQSN